jgi:hypothetical protein
MIGRPFAPWLCLALGPVAAVAAAGELCLGVDCGRDKESYRCHSIDARGVECWSPDDGCERAAGFSREREGARRCPLRVASFPGGGLTRVLGGWSVLDGPGARAASARADRSPAPIPSPEGGTGLEGERGGGHFDAVTTTVEREDWTLPAARGETWGAAVSWLRETASGRRFSAEASAQRSEPTDRPAAELVHGAVGFGHSLAPPPRLPALEAWWGVAVEAAELDEGGFEGGGLGAIAPRRFAGASAHLGVGRSFASGRRVAGAVVFQILTGHDLGDDLATVGLGGAWDLPLGSRFLLEIEAFGVEILTPDQPEDRFVHLSALGTWFASPRFALTLGYRTLEGLSGLDSRTVTLGASRRFE